MSADVSFLLGYGGYCKIGLRAGNNVSSIPTHFNPTVTVPLLSGNYDRAMNVPMQNTFSTPPNSSKRNKIRTGTGVYSYSGAISFEMTKELCSELITENLFKRRSFLDIEMCDGEGVIRIPGAVWNSFGLQADMGGIVVGNLSFMSCNNYDNDISVLPPEEYSLDDFNLEPYWQWGNEGVQSFSINFSRTAAPIYLNERNWIGPTYIRVGLMDVSASITCWERWFMHSSIKLGEKSIVFNRNSFLSSKGYQIAGNNGEGSKTYNIEASGTDSNEDIFEIV